MILVTESTPHRLAWSVAFGVGSIFIPAPGLQTPFVVPVCWIFRLQLPLVYLLNWINNPLTWIPICTASYAVGNFFFTGQFSLAWPEGIPVPSGLEDLKNLELYRALLLPWITGSLILTATVTLTLYPAALFLVKRLRATLRA